MCVLIWWNIVMFASGTKNSTISTISSLQLSPLFFIIVYHHYWQAVNCLWSDDPWHPYILIECLCVRRWSLSTVMVENQFSRRLTFFSASVFCNQALHLRSQADYGDRHYCISCTSFARIWSHNTKNLIYNKFSSDDRQRLMLYNNHRRVFLF